MKTLKHYSSAKIILATSLSLLIPGGCISVSVDKGERASLWLGEEGEIARGAVGKIVRCEHSSAIVDLEQAKKSSRNQVRAIAYYTHSLALKDLGKHQEALALYAEMLRFGYKNKQVINEDIASGLRELREERNQSTGKPEC